MLFFFLFQATSWMWKLVVQARRNQITGNVAAKEAGFTKLATPVNRDSSVIECKHGRNCRLWTWLGMNSSRTVQTGTFPADTVLLEEQITVRKFILSYIKILWTCSVKLVYKYLIMNRSKQMYLKWYGLYINFNTFLVIQLTKNWYLH